MEPDASASRTSSRSVSCARRGGARQIKQINTYRIVVSRASATKVSLPDGNDKAIDPDQRGFLSRRLELPVFQTEGGQKEKAHATIHCLPYRAVSVGNGPASARC